MHWKLFKTCVKKNSELLKGKRKQGIALAKNSFKYRKKVIKINLSVIILY